MSVCTLLFLSFKIEIIFKDKEDDTIVKPEFEGLWNAEFTKYEADNLYNKKQKFPTCFKTKMEQVSFFPYNSIFILFFNDSFEGYLFANFR